MKRGEVWLGTLDPTIGTEIQKTRACLIISPDAINRALKRVMIAPMTSRSHPAPFRIATTFRQRPGLILLDQIRTVDKTRLVSRRGEIDDAALAATLRILREMFAP